MFRDESYRPHVPQAQRPTAIGACPRSAVEAVRVVDWVRRIQRSTADGCDDRDHQGQRADKYGEAKQRCLASFGTRQGCLIRSGWGSPIGDERGRCAGRPVVPRVAP